MPVTSQDILANANFDIDFVNVDVSDVRNELEHVIYDNVIYSGDYSFIMTAGNTLANNGVATLNIDDNSRPKKAYLKVDSISDTHNNDLVARLDFYVGADRPKYLYYYKSSLGHFSEIEVEDNITKIEAIACCRVASSASAQTEEFKGFVFSLSPSEKEKYLSENVYIQNKDDDNVFALEVEDTVSKIFDNTKQPSLVMNIFTDTHTNISLTSANFLKTMANIKKVNGKVYCDALVHLGDMLTPGNSTMFPTFKEVNYLINKFREYMIDANPTSMMVVGNHDGKYSDNYTDERETYSSMQRFTESYVVRDGISPWYYKDYTKIKTRVVFLATTSYDNSGNYTYGIGQNQAKWMAEKAFNTEDDWHIILIGHIHPYSDFTANSTTFLEGLTNAYSNSGTYTDANYGITVDFSSKQSTKVVAYLAGHLHQDAIIKDNSYFTNYNLSFPIIITATSNNVLGGEAALPYATSPGRIAYTVSEDLWDTMIYRRDLNKIYMIRFGAGVDREIDV